MLQQVQDFNRGLISFIEASPTPFHAVKEMGRRLTDAGYTRLEESDGWVLEPNKGYWVTRNDSSIVAFHTGHTGQSFVMENGIRMVGAHTDSPCLKIKPNPELKGQGCQRLAAEVYGGALLAPWFDRELSLAGRVTYKASDGTIKSTLVDFEKPIAHIPSLAIHLDRKANEEKKIQRQKELNMVLSLGADKLNFAELLKAQLAEDVEEVLDHEIYAYDTQPPAIVGLNEDFVASARLDNLLSCYIGLEALLVSNGSETRLLVCNDHEEVGSQSACGAQGPFLRDVLERLCEGNTPLGQVLARSMMVSADNAHAIHPNYPEKHDAGHGPVINQGPVIKVNANQRYATNSETSALFRSFANECGVELQTFVSRNDMGCGSTIGPITASEVGVATIDVGCPQWGMHSIRETAGTKDGHALAQVLQNFYEYDQPLTV